MHIEDRRNRRLAGISDHGRTVPTRRPGIRASLFLFATALAATAANADDASQYRTHAKPVERPAPRCPVHELRRNQQGWVVRSYVVTDDGRVVEPVIEESSGSRAFEDAAVNTVKSWRYEPACMNGEPVRRCKTKVRIAFAIQSAQDKVSRKFDVDGDLGDLELRCEWQRFVDQAREGVTWNIPGNWGDCSLVVYGKAGATFKLFEVPAST